MNLITVYYGQAHETREIQKISFPEPRTLLDALEFVNRLNRNAAVYGISYWVEF